MSEKWDALNPSACSRNDPSLDREPLRVTRDLCLHTDIFHLTQLKEHTYTHTHTHSLIFKAELLRWQNTHINKDFPVLTEEYTRNNKGFWPSFVWVFVCCLHPECGNPKRETEGKNTPTCLMGVWWEHHRTDLTRLAGGTHLALCAHAHARAHTHTESHIWPQLWVLSVFSVETAWL